MLSRIPLQCVALSFILVLMAVLVLVLVLVLVAIVLVLVRVVTVTVPLLLRRCREPRVMVIGMTAPCRATPPDRRIRAVWSSRVQKRQSSDSSKNSFKFDTAVGHHSVLSVSFQTVHDVYLTPL